MLLDLDERIRYVTAGPDHLLYLLTDNQNGRLLRLLPGHPRPDQLWRIARKLERDWFPKDVGASMTPGDPAKGKQAFLERCAVCHSAGATVRGIDIGPDLASAFGRQAGVVPGFNYSASMAHLPQIWDFVSLDLLLADPGRYVPGTLMAAPPITDPEVRKHIIGFLKQEAETHAPGTSK
jgi:cytochrome c